MANLEGNHSLLSRHKVWNYQGAPCAGRWQHSICVYGLGDLERLAREEHALFVNKLDEDVQPLTYECLEELLLNRTRDNYEQGTVRVDEAFYRKVAQMY